MGVVAHLLLLSSANYRFHALGRLHAGDRLAPVRHQLSGFPHRSVQVNAGMTRCSNYAHDKALMGGVAVPEPDELLADILALETWRAQIDKRNGETAKKRKAGPVVAVPAAVAAP